MSFNPFITHAMSTLVFSAASSGCSSSSSASKPVENVESANLVQLTSEQVHLNQIETAPVEEEQIIQQTLNLLGRVIPRVAGATQVFCHFMNGLHCAVLKLNRR